LKPDTKALLIAFVAGLVAGGIVGASFVVGEAGDHGQCVVADDVVCTCEQCADGTVRCWR
jgi:hypothetical protein